ncbi:hypothetical protein [Brevibacillus halotolerans]|uniref:hypothetical protein n=1 Tax=Brevibacillus halotolerans TaxID=1507437 RepID=UPI0015EE7198|nr:hypothetical protein [Brevibacillus halotolerans]MBA4534501.1 hypothetical protein [Brevibacillus halotolerans]
MLAKKVYLSCLCLFHYLKFDSLVHEPIRHKLYRLHPFEVEQIIEDNEEEQFIKLLRYQA